MFDVLNQLIVLVLRYNSRKVLFVSEGACDERNVAGDETRCLQDLSLFLSQIDQIVTPACSKPDRHVTSRSLERKVRYLKLKGQVCDRSKVSTVGEDSVKRLSSIIYMYI